MLQLFATIPNVLIILTAPKKSFGEKLFAISFITTLVSLSIAAFLIGTLFAVIIAVGVSIVLTSLDGIGLLGKVIEKYQASKAYNNKTLFMALINSHQTPEGMAFDSLLEIRFVELEYAFTKGQLSISDREEFNYISEVLKAKEIIISRNKKSPAFILQKLYTERDGLKLN